MSEETKVSKQRPLSPHLQVYRPQMTSVLSIFHRATGVALAIGTLMIVWWLMAAATSEYAYNTFMSFAYSWVGRTMLFGWTLALTYHLFNGIRHLIWDTGRLFEIPKAFMAGRIVLLLTVVVTAVLWFVAYDKMGGF